MGIRQAEAGIYVNTFDPGVTTGIVEAWITDTKVKVMPSQDKLTPWGLNEWMGIRPTPYLVICEDFELRPNKREGIVFYSAYLIGVLMALSEAQKFELRMQNAAYAKAGFYGKIENLKAAGVYEGGESYHHAMDAMRHFMQWFNYGPGYRYNKKQEVVLVK